MKKAEVYKINHKVKGRFVAKCIRILEIEKTMAEMKVTKVITGDLKVGDITVVAFKVKTLMAIEAV